MGGALAAESEGAMEDKSGSKEVGGSARNASESEVAEHADGREMSCMGKKCEWQR
jgi:hypothetical protein